MPSLISHFDNRNAPIVSAGDGLARTYFNLVRLSLGDTFELTLPGFETVWVVQSGTVDLVVGDEPFPAVGKRADIWAGPAEAVYAPAGAAVVMKAVSAEAVVAIAGGATDAVFRPFRIDSEPDVVEVGSPGTHSRRRICHILGRNGHGRSGSLLVSELYADAGCWSGYPPHKHDTDRGPEETDHEELYYFRYDPGTGFGVQVCYEEAETPQCFLVHDGDTMLIDRGYHPTVTSPGHRAYIFTILVGRTRRGLIQSFDPVHEHLTGLIPGIDAMKDRFR